MCQCKVLLQYRKIVVWYRKFLLWCRKILGAVLQNLGAVPQNLGVVLQNLGVVPPSLGVVLQIVSAVPQNMNAVTQCFCVTIKHTIFSWLNNAFDGNLFFFNQVAEEQLFAVRVNAECTKKCYLVLLSRIHFMKIYL